MTKQLKTKEGSVITLFPERESYLTDEQQLAVSYLHGVSIVNAGAGAGKSTVLIEKMKRIKHFHPQANIIMLSFTKKAVNELKERIRGNTHAEIKTFHSLFWSILKTNGFHDFKIIGQEQRESVTKKFIEGSDVAEDEVQRAFFISQIEKKTIGSIVEKYEKWLIEKKYMDFDIMQRFCLKLLKTNKLLCKRLQSRYQYILIDEGQDLSSIQIEIIMLITGSANNLMIVGDPRQSIYSFRGACTEDVCHTLKENYPGLKEFTLTRNYRSTARILALANHLQDQYTKLECIRCNDIPIKPELLSFKDEEQEAAAVINKIKTLIKEKNYAYKDIAVLFRSGLVSEVLTEQLLDDDIHFINSSVQDVFGNEAYRTLFDLIDYALDPMIKSLFYKILPVLCINNEQIKKVLKNNSEKLCEPVLPMIMKQAILSPFEQYSLCKWNKVLQTLPDMTSIQAIEALLSVGLEKHLGENNTGAFDKIREKAGEKTSLLAFRQYYKNMGEKYKKMRGRANNDENVLSLMTIHASKGLEFKAVFIIGVCDGVIPDTYHENTDIEEEKRLLYVAVTRAKEYLHISYPINSKLHNETNKSSRFLREFFI